MWLLFALLNPFAAAFRSLYAKKASEKSSPLILAWAGYIVPVFLFTPFLFFIELNFSEKFWFATIGTAVLNMIANFAYMYAVSNGELGEVMPITSFTPLFLLVSGPLIINELPNFHGIIGVVLIVVGSYILNYDKKNKGIFGPLKNLLAKKANKAMFLAAFVWSISGTLDKMAIQDSSIFQFISIVNLILFCMFSFIVFYQKGVSLPELIGNKKYLFGTSFSLAAVYFVHMVALSMTYVAYVVALKRLVGVISVLFGYFFLSEKNLSERFVGAVIMFIGVLFIVLS